MFIPLMALTQIFRECVQSETHRKLQTNSDNVKGLKAAMFQQFA